jgi:hypothetical protein
MISGKSKLSVSELEKTEYINFRHLDAESPRLEEKTRVSSMPQGAG